MLAQTKSAKTKSVFTAALLLAAIFAACGSPASEEDIPYARVDSTPRIFETSDFETVGFKVVKQYEIEGLTGATAAMHGFQKNVGAVPLSYELRFYNSHDDAVSIGTSFVEDSVGKDAVMVVDDMMWAGGNKQQREQLLEGGGYQAFYWDYLIFGNVIILCEGDWVEQSQKACDQIKQSLAPTAAG